MLVIAAAFPIIFIVLRVTTNGFSNGNGGRFFIYRPMLKPKTHRTMKSNHRPGAFARLERSVKRYMNCRSQFAHELTGANISRTLAAELIIGSGIFSTAFFAQNVITGAALIIAGLLIARRAFAAIDAQIDNDGHHIDRADDDLNEEGGAR